MPRRPSQSPNLELLQRRERRQHRLVEIQVERRSAQRGVGDAPRHGVGRLVSPGILGGVPLSSPPCGGPRDELEGLRLRRRSLDRRRGHRSAADAAADLEVVEGALVRVALGRRGEGEVVQHRHGSEGRQLAFRQVHTQLNVKYQSM